MNKRRKLLELINLQVSALLTFMLAIDPVPRVLGLIHIFEIYILLAPISFLALYGAVVFVCVSWFKVQEIMLHRENYLVLGIKTSNFTECPSAK
jgi:hypothetical protein